MEHAKHQHNRRRPMQEVEQKKYQFSHNNRNKVEVERN